jgi:hypothetical protein
MVTSSFDYVSQKQDGSMTGREGNPLAAQLLGAPTAGDKGAGALSQTLDKVSEANAQLLHPDAKLMENATPRDASSQTKADATAVSAGLQPGKNVLDDSSKTRNDTDFDPRQAMSIRSQADENVFSNLEQKPS